MNRRRLGRGATMAAGVAALALAAAGCGGGSSSGGSSSTAATTGGSTGGSGGALVVADTSSVQKLDPAVMTNFLDFQALGMIYQPLVTLNSALQVQPALATAWHVGDGGRSLTFALRHGVTFDDGSPLTSADVKATMSYIVKPSTGAAAASYLASVKSVSTPSRYTVVFHLSHPDSSLLDGLTSQNLAILSAKAIKAGTLATKPDGTGPYQYSAYSPNNSFTVARNPKYWGPAPKIGRIEFKTIANEQSIASALQAGTVGLGLLTEPQVTQQLQGQSSITVGKRLDLNYRALMIQSKGPLANVDARLAVQCAIDRRAVLQAAVLGGGKVVGPVPQGPAADDARRQQPVRRGRADRCACLERDDVPDDCQWRRRRNGAKRAWKLPGGLILRVSRDHPRRSRPSSSRRVLDASRREPLLTINIDDNPTTTLISRALSSDS